MRKLNRLYFASPFSCFDRFLKAAISADTYEKLHTLMEISSNRLTRIKANPLEMQHQELISLCKSTGLDPVQLLEDYEVGHQALTQADIIEVKKQARKPQILLLGNIQESHPSIFREAQVQLEDKGFFVHCPDRDQEHLLGSVLLEHRLQLLAADLPHAQLVVTLSEWDTDPSSVALVQIARILGIPVHSFYGPLSFENWHLKQEETA